MKEPAEIMRQLGPLGLTLVLLDSFSRREILKFLNSYGIYYKGRRVDNIPTPDLAQDLAQVFSEEPEKEIIKALDRAAEPELAEIAEANIPQVKLYCRNVAGLFREHRLGKVLWALANDPRKEVKRFLSRVLDRVVDYLEQQISVPRASDLFTQLPERGEPPVSLKELEQERQKVQALKRERDELRQELARLELKKREVKQESDQQAEESARLRDKLAKAQEMLTGTEEVRKRVRELEKENRRLLYEVEQLRARPTPELRVDGLTAELRRFIREWEAFRDSWSKGGEETVKLLRELEREVKGMRPIVTSLLSIKEPKRVASKRLGVFVDAQNIYYGAREIYGGRVDYRKLLDYIVRDRDLVRATAYVVENPEIDQTGFLSALSRCNFEIKREQLIVRSDGSAKGNWDMGIAIDILEMSERLGIVALVSGDGDFSPLLSLVKSKGVRVEVYGFTPTTALKLKDVADQFFPLGEEILLR